MVFVTEEYEVLGLSHEGNHDHPQGIRCQPMYEAFVCFGYMQTLEGATMPVSVWTSTLRRTIQTAELLPFPKLRWKVRRG